MNPHFEISLAGSESSFACAADDTILRAGLRQGLGLAYECNTGACGSCKFDLLEGEVFDLYPEASGLRAKEREKGKRLACQCVPKADCRIKIRTGDLYRSMVRPARFRARLISYRALTPDMGLFSFKSACPAEFAAGQYAMLTPAAGAMTRAYSMSNTENAEGVWEFIIRAVPGGAVSPLFGGLPEGHEVEIDGPFGVAYFRPQIDRPVVGIAGGSGLAPVLSIMHAAGMDESFTRDLHVFYGGRGPADIPDIPGLLGDAAAKVSCHPAVSMPELAQQQGWQGDVGFVHEFLPEKLKQPLADFEYYMAGPPAMIEAVVRMLVVEHKVAMEQIHFDRFF
ncbi:2Fe-2S iron-sulfur cluster-binding protein [Thauera linaloolentis]|uniref:PAH dioxygenase component ferredoxin reductase n=1 Tax=Thauera linaloolentis (strain DSM 12138 / JCM 21573 / CCUG 41526 / CIP 105981 / IAM 15112 / NBRC 102519 / 47Lol) TaxID=1123367 RepID=N6Y8C3_THAL4|nr:2Fe-2S iron-sulfur cluster-binding protein [Thauera linaloolentis]ENO87800.1 PAH dioxygenase component ferredoxin reductase [Thauera linaloolentis 47Lol = DSM 12138]MCM8565277.1 2Fe-2S iron-sulfur cluster-binding protein [Thauera linaloolentis]